MIMKPIEYHLLAGLQLMSTALVMFSSRRLISNHHMFIHQPNKPLDLCVQRLNMIITCTQYVITLLGKCMYVYQHHLQLLFFAQLTGLLDSHRLRSYYIEWSSYFATNPIVIVTPFIPPLTTVDSWNSAPLDR